MNRPQNTESPQSELASRLHDYFPQLSSDDIAKFETHLHEQNIAEERNGYRLNFVGREYARLQAGLPSDMLISPDAEHNAMPENAQSGNVFVTGDNLEALRHLQNAYVGKVKMIYIDPPYNTGKEFVYKDHFELDDAKLKTALGYSDKDIARLRSIQCKSSHSAWLTFMYPRLALAKKLLSDNGVIFVSIDDNEQANLKLLMDDIFGEGNLIAQFLWKKKSTTSNVQDAEVSAQVDYQLCYKRSDRFKLKQRVFSVSNRDYPNVDEVGKYRTTVVEKKDSGSYKRDTMKFEILGHSPRPGKRWQIGENTAREYERKNRFYFDGEKIKLKIYDFEDTDTYSAQPNLLEDHGSSDSAAKEVNVELFNIPELFDNPKPTELIKYFADISTNAGDLILDFFAGSGTTAHAVMQLNAEDGGNRKWIMVQLDEPTAENSEARKAPFNFTTIDQISRERIRRAGDKIKSERSPDLLDDKTAIDTGFKHYRLIEPEVRTLDKIETFDPNWGGFEDMITPMGGRETILTTWLIDDGYPFDTKIEEIIFDGYVSHYVVASQTLYLIDRGMTTTALKAILNRIGRGELIVSTIVAYPYSFEFERMRELEIGVKMVDDLKLNKRY